ncbi:TPA: hypothetical protein QHB43_004586 [Aeromonas hydrophila subsp. hydrophila]|nr:hypothetical protein [Aeromonas hydrophila subsp. hydrophila]
MRLVYLSPVPWSSIAQRLHFFVKAALRSGFTSILWIEPTPSRFPQLKDFRTKLFSIESGSFDKPEEVEVLKLRCIPIEPLGAIYDFVNRQTIAGALTSIQQYSLNGKSTVLVIGKPSRLSLEIMSCVKFHKIIFDMMDDFPQFFQGISARSMEIALRRVIKNVDMCFFSSRSLQEKYGYLAKQSELVLNACDEEFLSKCQSLSHERNLRTIGNRIFGYVGSIAEWFDWDSVIQLAKDNPMDKVVIVGPNYSRSIPELPENIELRKAVQHCEIPKLLSSFDFGLIPFKLNELTNSVDPVKYYEYVAAGLSVITTEFGEMRFRVANGKAVSFSRFQEGITSELDDFITWGERFHHIFEALLHIEKT